MSRCVLGMDISKKDISLALLKDNRFFEKTIPNSLSRFKEILNFLQKRNALKAECFLESTGSYSEAVADFLFETPYQKVSRKCVFIFKTLARRCNQILQKFVFIPCCCSDQMLGCLGVYLVIILSNKLVKKMLK